MITHSPRVEQERLATTIGFLELSRERGCTRLDKLWVRPTHRSVRPSRTARKQGIPWQDRQFSLDMRCGLEKNTDMGDPAVRLRMTAEEYLAFERSSEEKHEYADGDIFGRSGGTYEHSTIAQSIGRVLGVAYAGIFPPA